MEVSIKVKPGNGFNSPGWYATVIDPFDRVEQFFAPASGGLWNTFGSEYPANWRQVMGYCDFIAGSEPSRARSRLRRLLS